MTDLPNWTRAVADHSRQRVSPRSGTFAFGGDPAGTVRRRATRVVRWIDATGDPQAARLPLGEAALARGIVLAEYPGRYVIRARDGLAVVPFDFDLASLTPPAPLDVEGLVERILGDLHALDLHDLPVAVRPWRHLVDHAPEVLREYLVGAFAALARSRDLDRWAPAPPPRRRVDRTAADRHGRRVARRQEAAVALAHAFAERLRARGETRIERADLRRRIRRALDDLVAAAARPSVAAVEREIAALVLATTGEAVRVVRTTDGSRLLVLPAAFVAPAVEAAVDVEATAAPAVEATAAPAVEAADRAAEAAVETTDRVAAPAEDVDRAAVEQREVDRPLPDSTYDQVALAGRPDQKEALP